MTVVRLLHQQDVETDAWRPNEMRELQAIFAAYVGRGEAIEWAVGTAEPGAPQFYLLGPAPAHECVLCISRIGRAYVLEDGKGKFLGQDDSLKTLALRANRIGARRGVATLTVGVVSTWCAFRRWIEAKLEPVLAEPVEVLTHVAPQLAAVL